MELVADDYVDNSGAVVELLSEQKALLQRPLVVKGEINDSGPLKAKKCLKSLSDASSVLVRVKGKRCASD